MTPLEQAVAITTRAAEAHAADGAPWPDATHHTVRSLIDRLATARHLPATGLEYPAHPAAESVLDELGPLTGWTVLDIGEVHQRLLELTLTPDKSGRMVARRQGLGRRNAQGAWYTPPEIAQAMCRLSIGPQLDRLAGDPDPWNVLQVLAIDPSCGAGVFLVEAARLIAYRFAGRFVAEFDRPEPPPNLVAAVMPEVMRECIFGVDIDPVAVDLAKAALWLEVGGSQPFGFLDRNIICGNALDDEMPPAFSERRGEPPTAEERREAAAAGGAR